MSARSRITTLAMGVWFAAWGLVGLAACCAAVFALAWAADAVGLGKAVFDPPRPSAEDAHLILAGVAYQDLLTSGDCSDDCSGHEAGFAWAREHHISSMDECPGRSRSFVAGCQAYREEVDRITG